MAHYLLFALTKSYGQSSNCGRCGIGIFQPSTLPSFLSKYRRTHHEIQETVGRVNGFVDDTHRHCTCSLIGAYWVTKTPQRNDSLSIEILSPISPPQRRALMRPESTPQKIVQVKVTVPSRRTGNGASDRRAAIAAQRSQTHTSNAGGFQLPAKFGAGNFPQRWCA